MNFFKHSESDDSDGLERREWTGYEARPGGPTTSVMQYEMQSRRDHLLHLHGAKEEIALGLPPPVPISEEVVYRHRGCTTKGIRFNNAEQESELLFPITPPNVTIYNRDPIPHVVRITRPTNIFGRILRFLGFKKFNQPSSEVIVPRIPCPPLVVMVPVQNVPSFSEKSKQGPNLESIPINEGVIPATVSISDVQPRLDSSARKRSH